MHLRYIKQINDAVRDKPAAMAITTHLCRGNFRSSWAASGSYDFVAEALFSELDVDGFFLEYDDERSGGVGVRDSRPRVARRAGGHGPTPSCWSRARQSACTTDRWISCTVAV